MDNYGDAYKRELEKARNHVKSPKNTVKPIYDVRITFERFQCIVEELQSAGAPVFAKPPVPTAPETFALNLTIGNESFEVVLFNDAIRVFWRGVNKTPMIYNALSASRLNALARSIIERAVASALQADVKPERGAIVATIGSKIVKFPQ